MTSCFLVSGNPKHQKEVRAERQGQERLAGGGSTEGGWQIHLHVVSGNHAGACSHGLSPSPTGAAGSCYAEGGRHEQPEPVAW